MSWKNGYLRVSGTRIEIFWYTKQNVIRPAIHGPSLYGSTPPISTRITFGSLMGPHFLRSFRLPMTKVPAKFLYWVMPDGKHSCRLLTHSLLFAGKSSILKRQRYLSFSEGGNVYFNESKTIHNSCSSPKETPIETTLAGKKQPCQTLYLLRRGTLHAGMLRHVPSSAWKALSDSGRMSGLYMGLKSLPMLMKNWNGILLICKDSTPHERAADKVIKFYPFNRSPLPSV